MLISFFGGITTNEEPIKVISIEEAKIQMMDFLKNNIVEIDNMEKDEYQTRSYLKLKPSILKEEDWVDIEYDRPSKAIADSIKENLIKNGTVIKTQNSGTDMQIWTFENKIWEDNDKGLRVEVIVEFGEILGYNLKIDFDESFFW